MTSLALACVLGFAPPKLVVVSWDGGADWIVDRLLDEGRLPHLAKLKSEGASCESVVPAYPSKTAVGHAAMFTGKWGNENGVLNNEVFAGPTLNDFRRGFDANVLRAEPFWVTAANAGKNVVAFSAATSYPPSAFAPALKPGAKFMEFSGFESTLYPYAMHRNAEKKEQFDIGIGEAKFTVQLLREKDRSVVAALILTDPSGKQTRMEPQPASEKADAWVGPFFVKKGEDEGPTYFRLWSLSGDGQMELYQRRTNAIKGTESAAENLEYARAYGAFHDDPFGAYGADVFGKTFYRGGDGTAEERLLELVSQDMQFLSRGFKYGWKKWKPDVAFHYTLMSDSGGHQFVGGIVGRNDATASRLWTILTRIYELQDKWLGEIVETAGPDTIVAVVSDHGMDGCRRYIYPNVILEKAGLMAYDAEGKIDLAKSKAFVPNWSDFFVVVNTTNFQGGIVAPDDEAKVVDEVIAVLGNAKVDGKPAFEALLRGQNHPDLGIGGHEGGDVYLEPAPGLYPSNKRSTELTADMGPIGIGMHGFLPTRRSMGSIFYAGGGGLKKENLGVLRQIDLLPWLGKKIGVEFPRR